jgi:Asp-tRNA(Asn)/Glu-tRNA(Gln) amidotransferase A subunit family amidase
MDWEKVSEQKLQEIKDKLARTPKEASDLTASDSFLGELSAEGLRTQLLSQKQLHPNANGLVKAVCLFHTKQAKDNNTYFGLTDVLTESAILKAAELDKKVSPSNSSEYPLYGYIISVKDCIRINGQVSSCGLHCNLFEQTVETPFIDYIEKHGAVILSRTNVPQNLFAMESTNNIYGSARNPYNKDRSSGGSSGGDGVLVALGHVNAAIGSDIAGSLRIPAFFCGIYSLNMTASRVDQSAHALPFEFIENAQNIPDGQFQIAVTMGPMTKSLKDLEKFAEVMANYYKENPRITPVPWNPQPKKAVRVGVITEWDNLFELAQTNRRAMTLVTDALHKKGVQTVEIDMRPYIYDLLQNIISIFLKNKVLVASMRGEINIGEPMIIPYENIVKLLKTPAIALGLAHKLIGDSKKKLYIGALIRARKYSSDYLMAQVEAAKEKLIRQMKEVGVEILVCPGMMPAILKDSSKVCNLWAVYMLLWNGLKFCSGAMPVTRVQADEQLYESRYKNEFEDCMKQNMKETEGLPVGVQVVAGPWHDEEVIEVMKLIADGVNFS